MGNARNLADLLGTSTKANQVISTSGAITTTGAFTSVGIDDNADATSITINSSENVGIKTTSPLSALHIKDNDGIMLEDDGTTNTSKMQTLNAGGLRFYTGDTSSQTSRMTVEADGDVTISDGNLVIGTSGHGIDFSSNTESSVSGVSNQSELLDYYEEGTWTPAPKGASTAGSVTSGTTLGRYTRVGNMVTVEYRLNAVVLSSASGSYRIGGLPYTVGGTDYNGGACALHSITFDGDQEVTLNATGTELYFIVSRSGTSWTSLDQSAFGSQHYSHGTITYTV